MLISLYGSSGLCRVCRDCRPCWASDHWLNDRSHVCGHRLGKLKGNDRKVVAALSNLLGKIWKDWTESIWNQWIVAATIRPKNISAWLVDRVWMRRQFWMNSVERRWFRRCWGTISCSHPWQCSLLAAVPKQLGMGSLSTNHGARELSLSFCLKVGFPIQ